MNDVTFTMDQIRRKAFELLGDAQEQPPLDPAAYTAGIVDLVLHLSVLAGEYGPLPYTPAAVATEPCLDKNGEARG